MQFTSEGINETSADEGAFLLMELAPLLMRAMRVELRAHGIGLSVVQLRSLAYLKAHPGISLSEVSEQAGLDLSTTSRAVNHHVALKLVTRQRSPEDRRRVTLFLTEEGRSLVEEADRIAQSRLAQAIRNLPAGDLGAVFRVARVLLPIFAVNDDHGHLQD